MRRERRCRLDSQSGISGSPGDRRPRGAEGSALLGPWLLCPAPGTELAAATLLVALTQAALGWTQGETSGGDAATLDHHLALSVLSSPRWVWGP